VLLWADGRRILTDTGSYGYTSGERRQYERSVAAHNTVQYDDVEPIPVGGRYLLGRRFDPVVRYGESTDVTYFAGSYARETALRTLYCHERRVYSGGDWRLIWDTVDATEPAPIRSRLHVAPELDIERATDINARLEISSDDEGVDGREPLIHVLPLGGSRVSLATSPYFPEFGRAVTRPEITLEVDPNAGAFGFLLSTEPYRSVAVKHDGGAISKVSIGGTDIRLPDTTLQPG